MAVKKICCPIEWVDNPKWGAVPPSDLVCHVLGPFFSQDLIPGESSPNYFQCSLLCINIRLGHIVRASFFGYRIPLDLASIPAVYPRRFFCSLYRRT